MSDLRKAAQSVIQAWDDPAGTTGVCRALDDLRAALAEPEQEPLTDVAIGDIYVQWDATPGVSHADFARAIERAHGIGSRDEQ